jgi:hypothetical protein
VDYSLIHDPSGDGLLVEEFIRGDDHVTLGLTGLLWTASARIWRDAATFGRDLRTDPALLDRVTPTDRAGAADAYRRLGGGDLPAESDLRGTQVVLFATTPPFRLGRDVVPAGYRERRHYRVLFAKDLPGDPPDPGSRTVGADRFTWELRRVGARTAWALDVTVLLAGSDDAVGPVLHDLTDAVRARGLVPVTTERFA